MRSKAPLALIEQMVMLLVFALAAALCLQAFMLSDRISSRNEADDRALEEAQNVAEVYRSCEGSPEKTVMILGGRRSESGGWECMFNEDWEQTVEESEAVYRAEASRAEVAQGLGSAEASVRRIDAEASAGKSESGLLCTLPVAWQSDIAAAEVVQNE